MELKKIDIELISKLFEDSKQSNRQLSRDLKISKETVSSKINLYLENEIIKSYQLKINYSKLGFTEFNLFIRFKKISKTLVLKFIEYLEKHPNTTWIGKSFGKYDLKVAFIIENISNINEIIFEISSKYGKEIEILDSLYVIDKYKSSSVFLIDSLFNELKTKKKNLVTKSVNNLNNLEFKTKFTLEPVDKKILYVLGQNPKISYVELAVKFGYTAEGIKSRIKVLEKEKIILGNSIVINGNKLNKIWCLVLLNINSEKNLEFKKYLQNKPFLTSYVETMGIWNFNMTFFASNISELYENLNQIRYDFSEEIRNMEFVIFFDIYKFPQIPKCILN